MKKFATTNLFSRRMYGFLNRFAGILVMLTFISGIFNFFSWMLCFGNLILIASIIFLLGLSSVTVAFSRSANGKANTLEEALSSSVAPNKKMYLSTLVLTLFFTVLTLICAIFSIMTTFSYVVFGIWELTSVLLMILYAFAILLYVLFPFFLILAIIYLVLHLLDAIR